ncbi:hypothetical protein DKK66_12690 [Aquitalea sp. USM4]|nr:hypothetical protein DKK66_12690 [Aquitalea sp. USM4]
MPLATPRKSAPDCTLSKPRDVNHRGAFSVSEPAQYLLRFGDTALKTSSECSFTLCKFRFLSRFCLVSL